MRASSMVLALGLSAGIGCGARTGLTDPHERDGGAVPDGGRPDGARPALGFCEGENKVEVGGRLLSPAPMTIEPVLMDCCEAALVRVHSEAALGVDLALFFRSGAGWQEGRVDLGGEEGLLEVSVGWDPEIGVPGQRLSGWVRVEPPATDAAGELTFCVTVEDEEPAELRGSRLYGSLPLMAWGAERRFGIWLLEDRDLSAREAAERPLGSLELGRRIIDLYTLGYYVWSEHRMAVAPWGLPDDPAFYGVPFVLTVDDERLYLGAFMSPTSSASFDGPTIVLPASDRGELVIESGYPPGGPSPSPDPRSDPRLHDLLEEMGRLVP